jgi:TonB family protein
MCANGADSPEPMGRRSTEMILKEPIYTRAVLLFCLLGALAVIEQSSVCSQAAQKPDSNASPSTELVPTMPSEPAAILSLAARANGLDGPDVQPWHIKVSYQTFDRDGDPEISGAYEEFWISPRKYKRSYASPNFTQTDFATDGALYRSGNQEWPGSREMKVRKLLIQLFGAGVDLQQSKLVKSDRSFSQTALQCIAVKPRKTNITITVIGYPETFPQFCFEQKAPILRFDSEGGGENDTVYNNMTHFQGRYLARDVRVTSEGKQRMTLHVDTLESLSNASEFTPSSDAIGPLNGRMALYPGNINELILKMPPPGYPASAKQSHVQGTVVVQAIVGKDGKVIEAHAVSGPVELQEAATNSVRKWEFRPFQVMGEPVEFESKFEVFFALAR